MRTSVLNDISNLFLCQTQMSPFITTRTIFCFRLRDQFFFERLSRKKNKRKFSLADKIYIPSQIIPRVMTRVFWTRRSHFKFTWNLMRAFWHLKSINSGFCFYHHSICYGVKLCSIFHLRSFFLCSGLFINKGKFVWRCTECLLLVLLFSGVMLENTF